MQENQRDAVDVRKHRRFKNGSGHSGKSSLLTMQRYKDLHCRYCKALLKKGREDTFFLNSQMERENELKYNIMILKLTKGIFCFPVAYFTRLNKYREFFFN